MYLKLALLSFLLIFTSPQSAQDKGKSNGKSHKASAADQDSKKKIDEAPAGAIAPQSQTDQRHLDNNQDKREESKKPIHDWVDLLNSISTAVVAAFTVAMVFVVYNQNRATKLTERAWVVTDFEPPATYSPGATVRFAWTLKNLGQTPAWITEMSKPMAQTVPAKSELPPKPAYEIQHPFPKEGLPMTPNAALIQFVWVTSERQAKVEVGEIDLYIFGIIKYKDIFGSKHETRYCYRFNPALGRADPVTREFVLVEQPGYNRAT